MSPSLTVMKDSKATCNVRIDQLVLPEEVREPWSFFGSSLTLSRTWDAKMTLSGRSCITGAYEEAVEAIVNNLYIPYVPPLKTAQCIIAQ